MSDEAQSDVQKIDEFLKRIQDIENSQISLIEKIAKIQAQATEAGRDDLSEKFVEPFSNSSNTREAIKAIRKDLEMERNRKANEA